MEFTPKLTPLPAYVLRGETLTGRPSFYPEDPYYNLLWSVEMMN